MKRVTIADVAKKAGVSKSTVSYALSNKRSISEETRIRIQSAIDELGYRPNAVAKQLRMQEMGKRIGFVLPLVTTELTRLEIKFIAGASRVTNQLGYIFILLAHADRGAENLIQFAQSGLVDGFVLLEVLQEDERIDILKRENIPFVLIGRTGDNHNLNYVDVDVDQWVQQPLEYLVANGHNSIAYLYNTDMDHGFALRAYNKFKEVSETLELSVVFKACTISPEDTKNIMEELLDAHPDLTAAVVWSDIPTIGVVQAVTGKGKQVPDDFFIICQEHSYISELSTFIPSIIDIQAETLAAQATQILIDILENTDLGHVQQLIQPKLIIKKHQI